MNKLTTWLGGAMLGALGATVVTPAISEAGSITINNVTVTSTQGADVQTWCMVGCADPDGGAIWAAGAGTVINSPNTAGNKNLILTQNSPSAFNFDTSEHIANGNVLLCQAGSPCTITIQLNTSAGVINVPLPAANAINNFNGDPGGTGHQEAQNWTQVLDQGLGGVKVSIGYADTAHSDACSDNNAGIGGQVNGNCLPDNPWSGSANTVFIGQAVTSASGCARPGVNPCYDAGTILIQLNDDPPRVPEPASMFLLGAGLIGLAAWNRKRRE